MLADATVAVAEAARDVVEARAAKMLLRAQVAGTIAIDPRSVGLAARRRKRGRSVVDRSRSASRFPFPRERFCKDYRDRATISHLWSGPLWTPSTLSEAD
jgi:hypothetical protein